MTKNQFLDELKKELLKNHVAEVEDILSEYADHFSYKEDEGFTEEEIAAKLAAPKEIASDYVEAGDASAKSEGKGLKIFGVTMMSIPLFMIYILMWGSVVVLGAFSVATLAAGFCLITRLNIAGLVPSMPYLPALITGISLFGLSLLSAVGTVYMFLYVKQWGKAYVRYCGNLINGTHYPSVSKHPKISKRTSAKLKMLAIIGLVSFVSMLVVGYLVMCAYAGSAAPWHEWKWFE